MPIVYIKLEVSFHDLNLVSNAEMEEFRENIKQVLEENHPSGYSNIYDGSVEVEIIEHAGHGEEYIASNN